MISKWKNISFKEDFFLTTSPRSDIQMHMIPDNVTRGRCRIQSPPPSHLDTDDPPGAERARGKALEQGLGVGSN